ncbi:hypothetical protein [Paenibacillus sp. USDA918EY]|uniref:hypothetical protein n=1 Tax=Paenibacillus sp. USDA918EY TaxID=2689575 RepID=UPI00135C3781|nr:hypothetical protein [Paenibacillus sp. USDA918EY]
MENVLVVWTKRGSVEEAEKIIKLEIGRQYGFSESEFDKTDNGFSFLFDDETNCEASFSFTPCIDRSLKISVCATWAWDAIDLYHLTQRCSDKIEGIIS